MQRASTMLFSSVKVRIKICMHGIGLPTTESLDKLHIASSSKLCRGSSFTETI